MVLPVALLLAAGGWMYTRRTDRVPVANYVPESALGYLEINNLPQLLNQLASTRAWQQVAPAYGLSDKLSLLGRAEKLGWLAGLTGNSDAAVFSQAQIAIVITGLEARGETIKPRFALILLAAGEEKSLRALIGKRLPELANNLLGATTRQTVEQAGLPVTIFSAAANPEKQLFSVQMKDAWLLSNNIESMRDCLMTWLRRQPSMVNNFYLQKARPSPGVDANVFGFVTADGVKRLLRLGTYLASGGVVGKAALAGAVGEVFTEFANRTCDGLTYVSKFEKGPDGLEAVDRYTILLKPDLTDKLKAFIKANEREPLAPGLIPAATREVTIFNVNGPTRTIDEIEKAISARVDVAQSFLLRQFMIGMREAVFGVKSIEMANTAIGDEIVSYNLSQDPQNRVWLIAARDQIMLSRLAENVLTRFQEERIATIQTEDFSGYQILNSSEPSRGSAVFIGDFLALGSRDQLLRLIESYRAGQTLKNSPRFTGAKPPAAAPLVSYSSVKEETSEMMLALARLFGQSVMPVDVAALDQLPLAESRTSLNEHGVVVESRSAFGNFPFLISLTNGSAKP